MILKKDRLFAMGWRRMEVAIKLLYHIRSSLMRGIADALHWVNIRSVNFIRVNTVNRSGCMVSTKATQTHSSGALSFMAGIVYQMKKFTPGCCVTVLDV